MDAPSRDTLIRLIGMGAASLLQYVRESVPWSPNGSQALDAVCALAKEEQAEVARFTRWLQKKHERVPFPGSYPSHFTTLNFVSIDYLLPKLVAESEHQIAAIEKLLMGVNDEEVRALVEDFLAMKRRHLAKLQTLCKGDAPTAV